MKDFKLYSIVCVQRDGYRHFGEVLSRRTPSDTYMVRTVPGHSGTLVELPASALSASAARIKWVHYAEVSPPSSRSFNFPVDMLRYDYCAPLNFNVDTGEIVTSFGFDGLIVAAASERRQPHWTVARWDSFWWKIRPVKSLRLEDDK